jgi:Spy/CpxP family protein refolding chaperone
VNPVKNRLKVFNRFGEVKMKLLSRTLMLCAAATLSVGLPAFSAEEFGSVEEQNFDTELMAILPASAEVAILPDGPAPADDTVGAGMPEGGKGKWGGGHHHGMFSALEGPLAVSDDQFEKLHALHNAFLDRIAPKKMELGKLHRQFVDALVNASMDPKTVSDLGTRINSLKSDIAAAKLDHVIASAQVLTSDQRKALHEHMIRHQVEMEHGGHGGHGGPGGHHH